MAGESRTVGPYRLLEPLGRGGMGVVYRAAHQDGRLVALKTVQLAAESQLSSLRREIHALARLRHPGIVRILDEGLSDGLPWYAMELLEGLPLQRYAQALGPGVAGGKGLQDQAAAQGRSEDTGSQWWTCTLERSGTADAPLHKARSAAASAAQAGSARSAEQAADPGLRSMSSGKLLSLLRLMRRLCASLAYLHGEGLVHRDLKPENVLVKSDGTPVLVDFGLATQFTGEVSREALAAGAFAAGTISTMSPEQIRGELVDARADLYALGCILYEILAGRPPFVGETPVDVLWEHLNAEPEPLSKLVPQVPEPLEALVLRLLAKSPRERLGYADDVAAALGRLGTEEDSSGPRGAVPADWPKPRAYLYRPGFAGREEVLSELQRHRIEHRLVVLELQQLDGKLVERLQLLGAQARSLGLGHAPPPGHRLAGRRSSQELSDGQSGMATETTLRPGGCQTRQRPSLRLRFLTQDEASLM